MNWNRIGKLLGLGVIATPLVAGLALLGMTLHSEYTTPTYSDLNERMELLDQQSTAAVRTYTDCQKYGFDRERCKKAFYTAADKWQIHNFTYSTEDECDSEHGEGNCWLGISFRRSSTPVSAAFSMSTTSSSSQYFYPKIDGYLISLEDLSLSIPLYPTIEENVAVRADGREYTYR